MDLYALATQMGTALAAVTPTLRVYPYGADKIEGASAVVTMPDEYGPSSYGRGARHVGSMGVLVCVRGTMSGHSRSRQLKQLYGYCSETGTTSVLKAVEDFAYTACASMAWKRTTFDVLTFAGIDYLTALLEFDADGAAT